MNDTLLTIIPFVLPGLILIFLCLVSSAFYNLWKGIRNYELSRRKRYKEKRKKQRAKGKKRLLQSLVFHTAIFLFGTIFLFESEPFSPQLEYPLFSIGFAIFIVHCLAYHILPEEDRNKEKHTKEKEKRRLGLLATAITFVCFLATYILLPLIYWLTK